LGDPPRSSQGFRPLLLRRPHRAAFDKLVIDPRLAGVFLAVPDVFRPARDPVHHVLVVPADMRDRRLVVVEIRGHVAADQGNILRHLQTPVEQEPGRGVFSTRLVALNRQQCAVDEFQSRT